MATNQNFEMIINTNGNSTINEQFKEIRDIEKEFKKSIQILKKDLIKAEVSRLLYEFLNKITCVKKSPQYPKKQFFMVGDKVCIQHDIEYNTFNIKDKKLFMEDIQYKDIALEYRDTEDIKEYITNIIKGVLIFSWFFISDVNKQR